MGDDERDDDRTDLERVGLFVDGPYDTEVTLYRPDIMEIMGRDNSFGHADDPLRLGGPFPIIPGHKLKAGTNDWVFSPFLYLWEEEPYDDPGAWRRRWKAEQKEVNISEEPFVSSFGFKTMNGLGTYYGTFITEMEAFSPETEEKTDDRLKGVPNFVNNPGKKGTGYGYVDVTINPYPEHEEDPLYDLTEARREMREEFEARMLGGIWIPTAHPGDFLNPNPFIDDKDPDGENSTYDWDRLIPPAGFGEFLAGPWIPNTFTKCINGNKDVIPPLERFPEYDPSDPWEVIPTNVFRKPEPELSLDGPWKAQFGNRTRQSYSVLQYNIKFSVNPMTFHLF